VYVVLESPNLQYGGDQHATVFLNRAGSGGPAPGSDDIAFSISYSGRMRTTGGTERGMGDPTREDTKYSAPYSKARGVRSAGARSSGSAARALGAEDGGATFAMSFAERDVGGAGVDYYWPSGAHSSRPDTWGTAHLTASP
jgi:hypothetical protein